MDKFSYLLLIVFFLQISNGVRAKTIINLWNSDVDDYDDFSGSGDYSGDDEDDDDDVLIERKYSGIDKDSPKSYYRKSVSFKTVVETSEFNNKEERISFNEPINDSIESSESKNKK